MKKNKISVCIATYNGEKYIEEQLNSIICQLGPYDEVIISDDSSTDNTVGIVKNLNDKRIKLYENQKFQSPIYNFESAIKKATGDVIILSDQDDIWEHNKIEVIQSRFLEIESIVLEMYNGICIDKDGKMVNNNLFDYLNQHDGFIVNLYKNSFIGCNLAFSKNLKSHILPFPRKIPMHDSWIGLCGYLFGNVTFVNMKILRYRIHDNNYTGGKTSLIRKIKWRINLFVSLLSRYFRVKIKILYLNNGN